MLNKEGGAGSRPSWKNKNLEYEGSAELDGHVEHGRPGGTVAHGGSCWNSSSCRTRQTSHIAEVGNPDIGENVDSCQGVGNFGEGGSHTGTCVKI